MNLNILYATVTGNAEMVAKKLHGLALEKGFTSSINEMNYHTIETFKKLDNVAIITSTYGEGEVPESGLDFWEDLKATETKINNLNYGLIALGDRNHDKFCNAGKEISKKLDSLKCNKIVENLECDGDTEGSYEWSLKFLDRLKSLGSI